MNTRYQHQMPLLGLEAQQLLAQSTILLVGVGGLGCPCANYLVAAGVGHVKICDGDIITLSNLHRQLLFTEHDLGLKKVVVAKERLLQVNREVRITAIDAFITMENASTWMQGVDIVIDCCDNYVTRFIVSEAAAQEGIPYLFAANFQYEGQVAMFTHRTSGLKLKKLFPALVQEPENCSQRGALGPVLGVLGSIQALEAIKWLTKQPHRLDNELLLVQLMEYSIQRFSFGEKEALQLNRDKDLSAEQFHSRINQPDAVIIDVRQPGEKPMAHFRHQVIPLPQLHNHIEVLPRDKEIVLFCHSGIRSAEALDILEHEYGFERVSHLKGGIVQYLLFLQPPVRTEKKV